MGKHTKPRVNTKKDFNQVAFAIGQIATGEVVIPPAAPETDAMKSGRQGGLLGGRARADSLTPEQRSEVARKAARVRWDKNK